MDKNKAQGLLSILAAFLILIIRMNSGIHSEWNSYLFFVLVIIGIIMSWMLLKKNRP